MASECSYQFIDCSLSFGRADRFYRCLVVNIDLHGYQGVGGGALGCEAVLPFSEFIFKQLVCLLVGIRANGVDGIVKIFGSASLVAQRSTEVLGRSALGIDIGFVRKRSGKLDLGEIVGCSITFKTVEARRDGVLAIEEVDASAASTVSFSN